MAEETTRKHYHHAEAKVLSGNLVLPLVQEIKPLVYAKLPEEGGYLSNRTSDYRLESVISFRSAYTQVAGNRDVKPGHGWTTLATSVIEGLNVLDVVTADRVVAQVAADHPLVGYVPSFTFLGTRFENLRIAGHPVKLDLDLNVLGAKPDNDAPHTRGAGFMERVFRQLGFIREQPDLPVEVAERYNQLPSRSARQESIECSLVNQAEGSYPGRSFGHVIDVPHFGRIYLATLQVEQSDFEPDTDTPRQTTVSLTMLDLRMGCIVGGHASVGALIVNGRTRP